MSKTGGLIARDEKKIPISFCNGSVLRADRVPPFQPAPMWVGPVMDEEAPAEFEADEAEPGDELPSGLKINAPNRPTRKELEEHSVSHLPFRSWCEACIRGKAKANPHKRGPF